MAEGEEVVFNGADSVEAPAIGGDALGELGFHGSFGGEALYERGGEGVVHDAIGVGHGGYLAGEIMAAGVQSGRFFAFLRPGTRGTQGVAAVGFELFFGDHVVRISTSTKVKHTKLWFGC